ncbi:MAG: nucleotide sugar dehydrogenase [Gemmatimonadales bacterium]
MPLEIVNERVARWEIREIAVVGPGIVGMPMAALLARARVREGTDTPARVTVIQRNSPTSGWKVAAINQGRSPIGGVEPGLDAIVRETATAGLLRASHDYQAAREADVVLVCVQTDKDGLEPDYGPLYESLDRLGPALAARPAGNLPLVIFESTLAPSSMATVIRERFARHGLEEGRDVLLGNSPNRVMPGRLVERVAASDKLAGGLSPATPELIKRLYDRIVTRGTVHPTNSLTAEVVKTLENAYRDVRIAFSAEVARFCDDSGIDFYQVRQAVNDRLQQTDRASKDPNAVPSGGLLIPTVGVGGHCLPKDGILLYWRWLESGRPDDASLILAARTINDESPAETVRMIRRSFGGIRGRRITLFGTAYRFNSEDTRNSPTLTLAELLLDQGCEVLLHDPFVKPDDQNLVRRGLESRFTRDFDAALTHAELAVVAVAHAEYLERLPRAPGVRRLTGLVDGCNLFAPGVFDGVPIGLAGIGRGQRLPWPKLVAAVHDDFRRMERGVANELVGLIDFLNARYAATPFERVRFRDVQTLAGTCVTGCVIADPGPTVPEDSAPPFHSRLAARAVAAALNDPPLEVGTNPA